jgi:hypothetical protein
MTTTPFSEENKAFTDAAHLYAREHIYPKFFGVKPERVTYAQQKDILTSEQWSALDGKMAIDQLVSVGVDHFRNPLTVTFQERFRKPTYQNKQDITITENNGVTGEKGELYKLQCQWFLYGYYDGEKKAMLDAVIVNVPDLVYGLMQNRVKFTKNTVNTRTKQPFVGVRFEDLHKAGLIRWKQIPMPMISLVEAPKPAPVTREGVFEWMNQLQDEITLARLSRYAIDLLIKLKEKAA